MQQGQVFKLKSRDRDGNALWAYRCRLAGRGSKRVQRGGFATENGAWEALGRALERARREQGAPTRSLTLAELVDEYLAQHDVEPPMLGKLRWLLRKAVAAFGDMQVSELSSQEIAAWRMTIPAGHRFEATQALRQVLARAVDWGLIEMNRKGRRCEPAAAAHRDAPVRELGSGRRGRASARPSLWAHGVLRGGDGSASGRVDRTRTSRRRSRGARRLRASLLHEWRLKCTKTEASARAVPLQARALDSLDQLVANARTPLLFPSPSGGYLDLHNFRLRDWRPAQRKAGIEPVRRVYDLRHTFATLALRAGISTFDLSRYMGASLTMIDRHYGHLARDGREHAIRLLDAHAAEQRTATVDAGGRSVDTARTNSPQRVSGETRV